MKRPDDVLVHLWRAARTGVRNLSRRQQVGRDLDDELGHFLRLSVDEHMRRGMSREAAERAARLELGGIENTRERVRTAGWESHLEVFFSDLKHGLRGMRRAPTFALAAVATLALGIGANTAMFSVIDAVLLQPLPYREADRLALLWTDDARRGLSREGTAVATIEDWAAAGRTIERMAHFSTQRVAPIDAVTGERTRSRAAYVSGDFFGTMGATPTMGRALSPGDASSSAAVAVISHAFWMQHFAGAPDVIGRRLTFEDGSPAASAAVTVVGVMPPSFFFPDRLTAIWTPSTTNWRFARDRDERFRPHARRWTAVARLRADATFDDARAELRQVGARLAAAYPTTLPDFPGFAPTVVPMLDSIASTGLQTTLWLLLGAVALVLIVACANVASLLLARAASRQQEFAVRVALGAGRGRLLRQLAVESLALACIGGATGALLSIPLARGIGVLAAASLPRVDGIRVDGQVLLFTAAASILAAIICGVVPARGILSTGALTVLRDGSRTTTGRSSSRKVLLVVQCTITVVLLAGAGVLIRSLHQLSTVDPGFDPRNVLLMRLELPAERPLPPTSDQNATSVAFARARAADERVAELATRIAALPGVDATGYIDDLFIGGTGNESITIPGRAASAMPAGELAEALVSPGFFPALRVPLIRGRYPTRDDAQRRVAALFDTSGRRADDAVLVNAAFAARYFPGEDPLGRRFCNGARADDCRVIVGIAGDTRRQGLDRDAIPQYYGTFVPAASGRMDLLVRTRGEPLAMEGAVRLEVARTVPGTTVASAITAASGLDAFGAQRRLQAWLLGSFAMLGLVLAGVGIYGLVHHMVTERTDELRIRIALGAAPTRVLRLVVLQGIHLPALGILIGLGASLGLLRLLADQLFRVSPTDPVTLAGVGFILLAIGTAASVLAGRRAVHIDPVRLMRGD